MKRLRKLVRGRAVDRSWEQSPPDPDLQILLVEQGLAAFDRQLAFSEIVGDRDWTFNQDDGVLRLGDDINLPAQILGSTSEQSDTWLWAWANQTIDEALTAQAREVARIGADRGMALLVERKLKLARVVDGHLLALAVAGLLDADAYFLGPHPGGGVFLLVDEPRVRQSATGPVERAISVITQALFHVPQLVTPGATARYLRNLGLAVTEAPDEIRIGTGESGLFRFDESGRLAEMRGTLVGDESPARDISQR